MTPAITEPDSQSAAAAVEHDRRATIEAKFAARAPAASERNQSLIAHCQAVYDICQAWRADYTESENANAERWGGPRYRSSGMPHPDTLSELGKQAKRVALNGVPLPFPSDLPAHVYEGKTKS